MCYYNILRVKKSGFWGVFFGGGRVPGFAGAGLFAASPLLVLRPFAAADASIPHAKSGGFRAEPVKKHAVPVIDVKAMKKSVLRLDANAFYG